MNATSSSPEITRVEGAERRCGKKKRQPIILIAYASWVLSRLFCNDGGPRIACPKCDVRMLPREYYKGFFCPKCDLKLPVDLNVDSDS
eukprot:g32119.t1